MCEKNGREKNRQSASHPFGIICAIPHIWKQGVIKPFVAIHAMKPPITVEPHNLKKKKKKKYWYCCYHYIKVYIYIMFYRVVVYNMNK